MDIAQTGLRKQPFQTSGRPVTFVPYHSQLAAHYFLQMILRNDRGIGVFYGPRSSGKTCITREFLRSLPAGIPVAVVDASRLKTLELLRTLMTQFDPGPSFTSIDDYWYALTIYLAEKTRGGHAPLLVLENFGQMYPSALYTLSKLAELRADGRYLLRMILVSDRPPFAVLHAPSMVAVARRSISAFELGPLTRNETSTYLHAKLRASGCDSPGSLIPEDIVDDLYVASGGWPGQLDQHVLQAMERSSGWPLTKESLAAAEAGTSRDTIPLQAVTETVEDPGIQKLYLTFNRKTLQEINLTESRLLIGRSGLCDVSIDSRFVSKYHALLLRTDSALHLLDLNSTNGTFVNSRRIQSKVLQHDDIISIGNHGIKLISPSHRKRPAHEQVDLAETSTLRALEELPLPARDDSEQPAARTGKL